MLYRIVETDNFGSDYPQESFLPVPAMREEAAKRVADAINNGTGDASSRYWKVVDTNYVLSPGFEP